MEDVWNSMITMERGRAEVLEMLSWACDRTVLFHVLGDARMAGRMALPEDENPIALLVLCDQTEHNWAPWMQHMGGNPRLGNLAWLEEDS